jgi:Caspase domain
MPGKRLGLLIGNSEYRSDSLRHLVAPSADVESLAAVLCRPEIGDFDLHTLLNATRSEIEPAVQKFFEERERDDLLLLYFSGHGLKNDRGDLFLAASDTERKYLEATAVSARFVHDRMQDCRAHCQSSCSIAALAELFHAG